MLLCENASVNIGDTYNLAMKDYEDVEIIGLSTGVSGTITLQRSVDASNYYNSDTMVVTSNTDFYGQFRVISPYARLYMDTAFNDITIFASSTSYV